MNRKAIRDLASVELGLKTAKYKYAATLEELQAGVAYVGMPCVVKPLMSSSGKGQSVIKLERDIKGAWEVALQGSRGDLMEVIVEEFVDFEYEITLLTLTQNDGNTLFCAPIGHRQENGDYQQSWQPKAMEVDTLNTAREMADKGTKSLGGSGIWGGEFFVGKEGVYFSELSPRPHDTGMVTLGGTQNYSEFELHARAIVGIPVKEVAHIRNGASSVILAEDEGSAFPEFLGIENAARVEGADFILFGKPSTRPNRRMGVAIAFGEENIEDLVQKAKDVAEMIKVKSCD
jgi:phosphoribosylglycinamide formyltransferase 2